MAVERRHSSGSTVTGGPTKHTFNFGFLSFIMPAIALGYYVTPAVMRLTRAGVLEVLSSDYVRTARAKGLRPMKVLFKHALRNAIIPVVSLSAVQFGFMLGGSPVGIYGINTQYAYGHLGYANIVCWADPQRDIAVSLMNTGKLAVGPHLKALPALLGAISAQCQPVVDMESDVPLYHRRTKHR